jgi:AraC-like DNA-binding protein
MGTHELAFVGLAGSGLGTALGVPMVWPRANRSLDARLLGTAVLLMSAIAALISARLAGLAPATRVVEHAINVLGLCAFPLLVLYTRYATSAAVTVRTTAWCAIPAAFYLATLAVRSGLGADTRVPFAWMLPVVLGFTIISAITVWTRTGSRRAGVVPPEWIVAFVVVLNVAQIVRMFYGHVALVRGVVPLVMSIGFLTVTAFFVWRAVTRASIDDASAAPRYERSGLEQSLAPDLLRRIDEALARERLFARADLTLTDLAKAAGLTPHQVSEVLNRYAGVSFHDAVNRRRVEDVKLQLIDPNSERFTIEGIGASAGFGSRSALYAAFKRFEGTTPSAFRASAIGRRSEESR